ncbi:MAG: hypothetical protein LBL23_03205 [Coriobacteriales bacterium]|jgi:hypothetical protein|nr:hypothetical protein [Coriobacteriales bacterium]
MTLEQMQQQLALLNGAFYLCVFLAVVCFVATLLMFWRFNILEVFRERTGIAARRAAAAFNEANATTTGPLAPGSGVLTTFGTRTAAGAPKTRGRGSGLLQGKKARQARGTSAPLTREGSDNTAVLPSERAKAANPEAFTGTVRAPDIGFEVEMPGCVAEMQAAALASDTGSYGSTATTGEVVGAQAHQPMQAGGADFVITREVMVIHTREGLYD